MKEIVDRFAREMKKLVDTLPWPEDRQISHSCTCTCDCGCPVKLSRHRKCYWCEKGNHWSDVRKLLARIGNG